MKKVKPTKNQIAKLAESDAILITTDIELFQTGNIFMVVNSNEFDISYYNSDKQSMVDFVENY